MLQEIEKLVYSKYSPHDKIWLFISLFDAKWNLLASNWVLTTDKSLDELVKLLYDWVLKSQEPKTNHIIVDVVNEITEQKDVKAFLNMDPTVNWVLLSEISWDKTWIILPNTKWITSMKQAIAWIKSKYQLEWEVTISTFTVNELLADI